MGAAEASGTGYDLNYSVAAIIEVPSVVDILAVTSSGPSGGNITGTFQVSGQINLTTEADAYDVYLDGTSSDGAIAWVTYTDDPTNGTLYNSTIIPPTNEPVSLSSDGSTMTFKIPVADVGSASSFTINVYAIHDGNGNSTNSWLGTAYPDGRDQLCNDTTLQCVLIGSGSGQGGTGGSGNPSGGGGPSGSSSSPLGTPGVYALVGVVVVVAIASCAYLFRRRGRLARPRPRRRGPPRTARPPPPPPP